MSRLPPLNALKAFEAAARHGGFIGASDELNVTRGAISRHVKVLEEHLGVQLFNRNAQGVRLTDAGRQFLPVLSEAFDKISREAQRISSETSDLRVICPPGTSIRWLLPKLDDFRKTHPQYRLRLTTDFHSDTGFEPIDADIGFSVANWPDRSPDIRHLTLFPTFLTPVCSPGYLRGKSMSSPAGLSECELLHGNKGHSDWTEWARQFAPNCVDPKSGQDFPNMDMATKAAVMGVGVSMADLILCREEIESGTLIPLFPELICHSQFGGISLLAHRDKWATPKVAAFRSWAFTIAEKDRKSVQRYNTA